MRPRDAFDQFQKFLSETEGDFHILEQRVPVEVQMEYFKFSNHLRKLLPLPRLNDADYETALSELHQPDATKDYKRQILSTLAISKQVKAYRILEQYAREAEPELADWSYMALMESRIALETELSDEKHIYISTGLGGKSKKLRFFVLLLSDAGKPFLDYQRQVIEREFAYSLPREDCKIERLTVKEKHVEMLLLVPIQRDIKRILSSIIKECNQYGNFLADAFTVTNVKELNEKEINKIIQIHESNQAGR
ncbi:MAG: hypothetical protein LBR49_08600 [Tannerella sp.]|jgi:hypothetical protein|nr:hypothetical protein [Tannerella sp.]